MADMASDFDAFMRLVREQARQAMEKAGAEAVEAAREGGTYRDVSGRLRASNRYEVAPDGSSLTVGNSAPYAAEVEARGEEVCASAALGAEARLRALCGGKEGAAW